MKQNHILLSDDQKELATIGFSKEGLSLHKGQRGLKYYLLVGYLRKYTGAFGHVTVSLRDLISKCGYSTNSHNQNIYNDWKEIINEHLLQTGLATCSVSIESIQPTTVFCLKLNYQPNVFFTEESFVPFNIAEYDTILAAPHTVGKSSVIGVYLFIKQYLSVQTNISYPSKMYMKRELGISKATIESAIKCLSEIGLLFKRNDFYVEDANSDHFVPTRALYSTDPTALTDNKACCQILEALLNKTVYTKKQVEEKEGKIKFLD